MSVSIRSVAGQAILSIGEDDVAVFDPSTLPEFGGIPIVERGSNSDGEYIRYADGTQICWLRISQTISYAPTYVVSDTVPWPVSFSDKPRISFGPVEVLGDGFHNARASRYVYRDLIDGSGIRLMIYAVGTELEAGSARTDVVAIGRWF